MITIRIRAEGKHADAILEHIINPALKDWECRVDWPDMSETEIAVTFDPDELCWMLNAQ